MLGIFSYPSLPRYLLYWAKRSERDLFTWGICCCRSIERKRRVGNQNRACVCISLCSCGVMTGFSKYSRLHNKTVEPAVPPVLCNHISFSYPPSSPHPLSILMFETSIAWFLLSCHLDYSDVALVFPPQSLRPASPPYHITIPPVVCLSFCLGSTIALFVSSGGRNRSLVYTWGGVHMRMRATHADMWVWVSSTIWYNSVVPYSCVPPIRQD